MVYPRELGIIVLSQWHAPALSNLTANIVCCALFIAIPCVYDILSLALLIGFISTEASRTYLSDGDTKHYWYVSASSGTAKAELVRSASNVCNPRHRESSS